jgi:zinc/manganese transport system permease protein
MNAETGILWPALVAGLLVVATHVPLGIRVLERGIVFIDLAVAQFAALGVVVASWAGLAPEGAAVQTAALGAALAGALALNWSERRWPEVQEAVIGVSFVLAANAAILLLAANPHGAEHLKELLTGQILWVPAAQLPLAALVSAGVLALWFGLGERAGRTGFYVLFAVAVTLSVQLVGIYLVFATLIIPALATRALRRRRLAAAYALAAAGYAAGLALSIFTDLPAGPLLVCVLGLFGACLMGFGGRKASSGNPQG